MTAVVSRRNVLGLFLVIDAKGLAGRVSSATNSGEDDIIDKLKPRQKRDKQWKYPPMVFLFILRKSVYKRWSTL
jgi:hypothetical protein